MLLTKQFHFPLKHETWIKQYFLILDYNYAYTALKIICENIYVTLYFDSPL